MKHLISPLIAALMLFVLMPYVSCTEARAASETLKYDDGTREDGIRPWCDEVGSEVAVRFTPSSYPVSTHSKLTLHSFKERYHRPVTARNSFGVQLSRNFL